MLTFRPTAILVSFASLIALAATAVPSLAASSKSDLRDAACRRAPTSTERTICADRDLTRKDAYFNEVYREARRTLSNRDFESLRREQHRWLAARNACGISYRCISDAYTDRTAELEGDIERARYSTKSHVETGCGRGGIDRNGLCRKTGYWIEGDSGDDWSSPQRDTIKPTANTFAMPDCTAVGRVRSQVSNDPVTVTFTNRSDGARDVVWINFDGEPVDYGHIAVGQSYTVSTYLTHPWMFTDRPGNCVEMFLPTTTRDARRPFEVTVHERFH